VLIFKWRKFLVFVGDVVIFYVALAAALYFRHLDYISLDFLVQHLKAFSFLLPVWALVFYAVGFYDIRRLNKLVALINQSIITFSVNLLLAAAAFYLFSPHLGLTPKTHLFLALLFFHLLAPIWRRLWVKIFFPKLLLQRVAFLGSNPLVEDIKTDLQRNPYLGFSAISLSTLKAKYEPTHGYWRPRGRRGGGLEVKFDLLVLVADDVHKNPVLESMLLSSAVMEEIPVITHLDFYEDLYGKIPPEHAAQLNWLMSNVLHKDKRVYGHIKRALGIFVSLLALVAALPVMALVYLGLKAEGGLGEPAFFFQKRVGYLGKRFVLWKFRTMVKGSDKAGPFSGPVGKDRRVTAFGRFLRQTRLDELPQLWNVLKGDMALVGPRPEWIREVNILEHKVPHYHLRHLVQPGLTGWAQIHLPPTSSETQSLEKLQYDLYYVKNMSLALDLGILLRTIRRVFQGDAAFLADSRGGEVQQGV